MKNKIHGFVVVLLCGLFWTGCKGNERATTPTTGALPLICDDAVSNVIQIQKNEFEKRYTQAKIDMQLAPASAAIVKLINNEVECIISSRELDSTETDFLIRHEIKVFSQKFALDGIAIIVNAENPIEEMSLASLRELFSGDATYWSDITDSVRFPYHLNRIQIVSDGRRSGNYRVLHEMVLDKNPLSPNAVVLSGDSANSVVPKILDFVASTPGAVGYVSTAWVGKTSADWESRSGKLKIIRVSGEDFHKAVEPIQGYVYRGDYPLRRVLYIIHRQPYIGLAAGFTAFLTGNDGQKICLANNLVPGMNPIRLKHE